MLAQTLPLVLQLVSLNLYSNGPIPPAALFSTAAIVIRVQNSGTTPLVLHRLTLRTTSGVDFKMTAESPKLDMAIAPGHTEQLKMWGLAISPWQTHAPAKYEALVDATADGKSVRDVVPLKFEVRMKNEE